MVASLWFLGTSFSLEVRVCRSKKLNRLRRMLILLRIPGVLGMSVAGRNVQVCTLLLAFYLSDLLFFLSIIGQQMVVIHSHFWWLWIVLDTADAHLEALLQLRIKAYRQRRLIRLTLALAAISSIWLILHLFESESLADGFVVNGLIMIPTIAFGFGIECLIHHLDLSQAHVGQ